MADPYAQFADAPAGDPYAQFADAGGGAPAPKPQPAAKPKPKPNAFIDAAKSYASGLEKGVAGVADAALAFTPLAPLARALSGGNPLGAPTMAAPVADFIARHSNALAHTPETSAGQFAKTAGQMTPAALVPGSIPARVTNVMAPTVGSEVAGGIAHAVGASPRVEQGARMVGAMVGGAAGSARISPRSAATPDETVANVFAQRTNPDPAQMAAQAQDMRAKGVSPTLLDVTGQKGLRLARAVGVTNDNAGETLQANAQAVSSTTKPAVMARTRNMSGETRTADQLAADIQSARDAEARTTFGRAYETQVPVTEDMVTALSDTPGRAALQRALRAAVARRDDSRVQEIQSLLKMGSPAAAEPAVAPRLSGLRSVNTTASLQKPSPAAPGVIPPPATVSAATLDRIQIAFRNQAERLRRNQGGDIASGLSSRQSDINAALDAVPDLQPARAAYRAKSQALDILNKPGARKDPFSTDPTDYKAWVDALPPEAQHANQVAIRQDILDTLGGQRAGTAGSIDELATSQYARQNLAHALGTKEATAYLDNLTARLQQRGNASFASPNAGSRTAVLQNDTGNALSRAVSAADTVHKVASGNVIGLAAKAAAWLKTRGISDQQAQALAEASVDPARLDGVIEAIRKAKGSGTAQGFVNFRGGLLGAARSAAPGMLPPPAKR